MNDNRPIDEMMKATQSGRGRQLAYVAAAILAMGLLIGAVVVGFRGQDIEEGSAAMTVPLVGKELPSPDAASGAVVRSTP